MIKPEDVTIIIPHLGSTSEQCYSHIECGKSLNETVPEMKVVVVKNGLSDCNCPWTLNNKVQGQCRAVNAAVATTNTPWIFITNDDMIYASGWLEKLQGLGEVPLCVSPKLVEPRVGAPTFEVFFAGGAGGDFDKDKWLGYSKTWEGGGLQTGFNLPLLIRRDLWDTIGGYDIDYDPWGSNSDSDLEYKIKLAGVQPYQNTDCVVYHFSQTSGTFNPANNEHYQRNFQYFKDKWGFDRTDDGIWEASFKIPTKEEGRIFNPDWENKYGGNA